MLYPRLTDLYWILSTEVEQPSLAEHATVPVGVALAATTVLELRARTAFAKRRKLPIEAYGAYWRSIMGERLKAV